MEETTLPEGIIESFRKERERLNELVIKYAGLSMKRFYNLDSRVYHEGVASAKNQGATGAGGVTRA